MRHALLFSLALGLAVLGGCGTPAHRASAPGAAPASSATPGLAPRRGGGYYQDDGPGDNAPPNLELTPDAVPRNEPLLKNANRPYVVFGKTYTPTTNGQSFRQRGVASWYGRKFHGQKTSSGEPYDMYGMTAAHPTLPIPSYVRVTNLANGRTATVRVNDRGPFIAERIIDLSYTAALKLGYVNQGSTQVEIEQVRGDGSAPPPPVLVASAPATPATPATRMPPAAAPPAPTPAAPPAPLTPPAAVVVPLTETQAVAAQPLPTATQPDGVYLQLGAFGAREGAEEFRIKVYQQLSWLNQTIYIVARDRLFRAQLGPYKDRAEAGAVAEKIRETLQFAPTFVLK